MTIKQLCKKAHKTAVEHGWYEQDDSPSIGEKLALIHSEVSEALECLRDPKGSMELRTVKGKPEGFIVELADVLIRVADLAEYLKLDLEDAVVKKMAYNETRPYKHGKLL